MQTGVHNQEMAHFGSFFLIHVHIQEMANFVKLQEQIL
jgi:hypothetical protein